MNAITEAIDAIVRYQLDEEYQRIEADLLSIPGVTLTMTHAAALELKLEVVYQHDPDYGMRAQYRGIRQAGSFIIDHHPNWDTPYGDFIEPEFWDDRTTPGAYSRQDSDRDLAARRAAQENGHAA